MCDCIPGTKKFNEESSYTVQRVTQYIYEQFK